MVILDIYRPRTNIASLSKLESYFQETLLFTNRTPSFFVNWSKVGEPLKKLEEEIRILTSISRKKDMKKQLKNLLLTNPRIARILPRIVAIHALKFPVVFSFDPINLGWLDFDKNNNTPLARNEIDNLLKFVIDSGIIDILKKIENLHDYLLGVEVGMDTNARKNRSGEIMENLIKSELRQICSTLACQMLVQKPFKEVSDKTKIPTNLKDRKADFIVHSDTCFVNIEVNFYSAGGSKPEEIVDSYINRYHELSEQDWKFIWITDGNRWSSCTNQLQKAFKELECVLNIQLVKSGVLESALKYFLNIH